MEAFRAHTMANFVGGKPHNKPKPAPVPEAKACRRCSCKLSKYNPGLLCGACRMVGDAMLEQARG